MLDEENIEAGEDVLEIPEHKTYAAMDSEGVVTQVTMTNCPSEGWVEVSAEDYARLSARPGHFKKVGDVFEPYDPPPPPDAPVTVSKLTLYRRTTEGEADAIDAALQQVSSKMRNTFLAAQTFRSDAPEWDLLLSIGMQLFTPERVKELLAPDPPGV